MKRVFLFFIFLPVMAISQERQGKLEFNRCIINNDNSVKSVKICARIWYKGNKSIQEVPFINIKSDSNGSQMNSFIKYYLFIDQDLKLYYYYKNFSDTAKVLMMYKGTNPIEKHGGLDIYSNKEFDYDSSKKLNDTMINGYKYNRQSFIKNNNGEINIFVVYTTCMKKNVHLKYLKALSEKIGCPIVRMDTFYKGKLVGTSQFQYVSDSLTQEELKIFDSWEKRVK